MSVKKTEELLLTPQSTQKLKNTSENKTLLEEALTSFIASGKSTTPSEFISLFNEEPKQNTKELVNLEHSLKD